MLSVNIKLANFLKTHGYSNTKVRQEVFSALLNSDPLSMSQLINCLPGVDRASIYRTVAIFENLGIVHRLTTGWKYKLELSDLFSNHHHHATCTECGKVVAFHESPQLEKDILSSGQSIGFKVASHSLEIKGICPQCQAK